MHKQSIFQIRTLLLVLFATMLACGLPGGEEEAPPEAVEAVVETVVVVATATEAAAIVVPTEAPADENAVVLDVPTPLPAEPRVTANVDLNVRRGPGTNYDVVGALPAGTSARIVGRSPDGGWWKIECPANGGSECWTSAGAQFSTAENAGGVPVAAVPPAPTSVASHNPTATYTVVPGATATYTVTPENGATATYTVTPETGATATTPTDPTATYTATPTEIAALIAPFDNDSLQNPAVDVFLSITGTRNFTHINDVSYSEGDQEDWVQFEFPNNNNTNQNVWITLDCVLSGNVGNAQLRATVYEDGVETTKIAICGTGEQQLTVDNTKQQQVKIHFGITNEGVYAAYTLSVVGFR